MNQVHRSATKIYSDASYVAGAGMERFSLAVPDGYAARLRAFELTVTTMAFTASQIHWTALSRAYKEPQAIVLEEVMRDRDFLAILGFVHHKTGSAGISLMHNPQRIELWDYDYNFVIDPAAIYFANGLTQDFTAAIYYEYVAKSEGERNSIIAWQGGVTV